MMVEDDRFVIKGLPPLVPISDLPLGRLICDKLDTISNEDEALVDALTGESISYKKLRERITALAVCLTKLGYGKNTIITICSENCIEFFIPVIAALYIGATVASINHNYTKREIIHALEIAQPKIIFCSEQVYQKFVEIQKTAKYIDEIVVLNSVESMDHFLKRSWRTGTGKPILQPAEVQIDEHVAFILYSSGTTGLPKGVMLTHKNVLTVLAQNEDPRMFNQDQGRCGLGVLPFFHSYGMISSLVYIHKQLKIIVLKKFHPHHFLKSISNYKITSLTLVPPLVTFLAKNRFVYYYNLKSVRDITCGAAPLGKDVEEMVKKRLKIDYVRQGYGLTETTLGVIKMPLGHQKHGSSGKVVPFIKCKIRDPETGKSLGPKQIGELCFKGPSITKGYYGDEEATRNSFTSDGWFLTGDLGYYDEEEYFYVVDRLKELIKYKGFQVAPAELEAVLLTNPKIKDAAVVGVPDEEAGELPVAFVVLDQSVHLTEKEVKHFLSARVSPEKKLRGGVRFVPEIPKTSSGKILRRELKELLKKTQKSKL